MFAASYCMPCPVDGVSGAITFRTLQNYRWQQMAATVFMPMQLCLQFIINFPSSKTENPRQVVIKPELKRYATL